MYQTNADQLETQLSIKMLAIEISEYQNHKKNMIINKELQQLQQKKMQEYLQFKQNTKIYIQDSIPRYSIFSLLGIATTRKLIIGGMSGVILGELFYKTYIYIKR